MSNLKFKLSDAFTQLLTPLPMPNHTLSSVGAGKEAIGGGMISSVVVAVAGWDVTISVEDAKRHPLATGFARAKNFSLAF